MSIFSIGHSTHEPDYFLQLMRGVDVLVDIRSHPTSKWEWWRRENMGWIEQGGIQLFWEPRLGGWTKQHFEQYHDEMLSHGVDLAAYSKGAFPKQQIGVDLKPGEVPESEGISDAPRWLNRGLWDYSWYLTTSEAHKGLLWLFEQYAGANQPNAAIMCAEALWWKCHRSMVADALYLRFGCDTLHLKSAVPKRASTSRFQRHSHVLGDRLQRYDPRIIDSVRGIPV